jgi:molybdate transport system regulatory protein
MGKNQTANKAAVLPRLRVMRGREVALGPGRVELLELIRETGSLRAAALRMGVSYMRAWNLVRYTNRCFCQPLVEASRGGKAGGGARLTRSGNEIVAKYRRMERQSQQAIKQTWAGLRKFLKT